MYMRKMFSKGALTLLSDYGGDSSDEEVPGPGVSVKRLHESVEYGNDLKKIHRLPVPNIFLESKEVIEHVDDPVLHSGRSRTFAHERGNWATYIYILFEEKEGIKELMETIKKSVQQIVDLKETDHLHISLTKTLILKHHWINLFVNSIKTKVLHIKKFMILFDSLKVYCNEERTRTFIGLQIKTGYDSLVKLVEVLDKCLEEFNLPPFYENPSFHMSIAWCVGDFEEQLKLKLPQLNQRFQELMDEYSQENWYIFAEYLLCKAGNKYFQFYLT